jgi:signal transduction histidine kinase
MKNADTQSASNLLDEAIQDVRNVSHNLMPADLSKGLITARRKHE